MCEAEGFFFFLNTLYNLFLGVCTVAKHLVIEIRTWRGKAQSTIFIPIHTSLTVAVIAVTGVSGMFFHCCSWMIAFDLLSANIFWRAFQRWALINFCPALLNLYQRFCLLVFYFPRVWLVTAGVSSSRGCSCGWTPNTDDWHAELQFLWKPQSKTFSGIKKPCQEDRQQALSDHSPPSLWLVTPNGIYSHVLELHSYPSIWPSFFTATYCQLQSTPIHLLRFFAAAW